MEKLTLNDGTEISILSGASENTFQSVISEYSDLPTLIGYLTEDNLSLITFYNESDVACAIYTDKAFKSATVAEDEENGVVVTVNIKDIDKTDKRLTALEDTVDTLVESELAE